MFRGRYQHTIDPKGRLSVPAKFRDALAQYDGALIVVPNDYCLEVHPLEEWQRIETKLREQSIFNPEVRELSRLFISRAKDVTLDAAGRVLIPPDARASGAVRRPRRPRALELRPSRGRRRRARDQPRARDPPGSGHVLVAARAIGAGLLVSG